MKRSWLRFGASGGMVLLLSATAALVSGSVERRDALFLAMAVAAPVQSVAFGLLLRFREKPVGFLSAWLGGTFLRLGALAGLAFLVVRQERPEPAWTLLGLVALFFVLHLLEPLALRGSKENPATADGHG